MASWPQTQVDEEGAVHSKEGFLSGPFKRIAEIPLWPLLLLACHF